jgi:hypothetical protein
MYTGRWAFYIRIGFIRFIAGRVNSVLAFILCRVYSFTLAIVVVLGFVVIP